MRRSIGLIGLTGLFLVGGCGRGDMPSLPPAERDAFQQLLLEHSRRYSKARVEDYYKLISQSVFGVGHLVEDESSTREYLEREIRTLGPPATDEPLIEPLDPQGKIIRVNLRPFAAQKLSQDALVAVIMETVKRVEPDTTLFLARWNAFRELVLQRKVDVSKEDFDAVDRYTREKDYPPLHHSDIYRGAYKPAYRVVLKDLFVERGVGKRANRG